MAPALRGRHFRLTCDRCQTTFCCDADQVPADRRAVCPNCGWSKIDLAQAPVLPPDRVRIKPIARPLARWQTVAVRQKGAPDREPQNVVKRVVGLPGESFAIIQGDLFANGQRLIKPLDVQQRIRVFVFDSDRRPPANEGFAPRFCFRPAKSDDGDAAAGESADDCGNAPEQYDLTTGRLTYQHVQNFRHSAGSISEPNVVDFYPYNQATSRSLHSTDQLYYRAEIGLTGPVTLSIDLWHRRHPRLQVRLQPRAEVTIRLPGEAVVRTPGFPWRTADQVTLEISTFDEQLLVLIDGDVIAKMSLEQPAVEPDFQKETGEGEDQTEMPQHPLELAFEAKGAPCRLQRLRLWRDLYYYDVSPFRFSDSQHPYTIGSGQYLLLGDNVPRSRDSRNWEPPGTPIASVLGAVEPARPTRESTGAPSPRN